MATTDRASLTKPETELRELFGDYKAEWLRERVFDLFTEPSYFPSLEGVRPCVLIGGRGTGKTTVLLRMAYNGAFHFADRDPSSFDESPYIGLYYKIDSNRVAPFRGTELSDDQWQKVFAHFFNLIACDLIVEFLDWYASTVDSTLELPPSLGGHLAEDFGVAESPTTVAGLRQTIGSALRRFELAINNVGDEVPEGLSVAGRPLTDLATGLVAPGGPFEGRVFVFLLDEYENLDLSQQRVINTLLKHSGTAFTFKIGVRQGGLRTTETLAPDQRLQTPADYAVIDIAEHLLETGAFPEFAERVCNSRLSAITPIGGARIDDVTLLFESLTAEEEAVRLGVRPIAERVRERLVADAPEHLLPQVQALKDLELHVLEQFAIRDERPVVEVFVEAQDNPIRWRTSYTNYRQAFLYTIKRGKTGVRKFYAGWDTVLQLAAGNIRLLMELVERCFVVAGEQEHAYGASFDPEIQTRAFQSIGRQSVVQLSSAVEGARLTRLLLGLGRVFGVLAAQPLGHTPEVTQFKLPDKPQQGSLLNDEDECRILLDQAVTELVLLRQYSTKLTSQTEVRDFEYRLHPAFSPFFVIPAGKKRRMSIEAHELLELASDTRAGIRHILSRVGRDASDPLADQLELYGDFYGAGD